LGNIGKRIRLNRILRRPHEGSFVVAFDHALAHGPIAGTKNPIDQIRRFANAGVDGILLNLGLLCQCSEALQPQGTPGIIARIDWTTLWNSLQRKATGLHSCMLAMPEEALRQGADAVLTYMIVGTGDSEFEAKEVERNARVARECERLGIPLIVETLARGENLTHPFDPSWLELHTRMAAELGADLVKTDYTGDPSSMRTVVQGCPIPILVLGGSHNAAALDVVRGATEAGAAGVFFGRNVFQADDMEGFLYQARCILRGIDVATPVEK
jgi:DhnA family fructose-bisphosphate aldolase class Ia